MAKIFPIRVLVFGAPKRRLGAAAGFGLIQLITIPPDPGILCFSQEAATAAAQSS